MDPATHVIVSVGLLLMLSPLFWWGLRSTATIDQQLANTL